MKLAVGITGGSGAIYALALLQVLRDLGVETHLIVTKMGAYVTRHECGVGLSELERMANYSYRNDDLAAAVASGSFLLDGMVILPCSMKTVACVAGGVSDSLLCRAADVTIKEGRKLVLVPRETPMSALHLENLLRLARLGATILPAAPAFYQHPETVADLVKFMVAKVLDAFRIEHDLLPRWGEGEER